MSILDLGQVIFGDLDKQIAWFQQKNLLSLQPNCSVVVLQWSYKHETISRINGGKGLYPRQCSSIRSI